MPHPHPNYIKSLVSRFDSALRAAKREAKRWATNDPNGMFFLGKESAEKRTKENLAKAEKALLEAKDTGHFSDEELQAWFQRYTDTSHYVESQLELR